MRWCQAVLVDQKNIELDNPPNIRSSLYSRPISISHRIRFHQVLVSSALVCYRHASPRENVRSTNFGMYRGISPRRRFGAICISQPTRATAGLYQTMQTYTYVRRSKMSAPPPKKKRTPTLKQAHNRRRQAVAVLNPRCSKTSCRDPWLPRR
jgi:hypothetical protein